MRVIISPQAAADLRAIRRYIARSSPDHAKSFTAELVAQARRLSDPALHANRHPEFDADVRRLVYGSYLILFTPQPRRVIVTAFLYGARDIAAILQERSRGDD